MQVQNHVRLAIASISNGTVDQELHDIFFPLDTPLPKECALWDYKELFTADKLAYAELAKDILSFFNSYGGYLFLGVSEERKDENFGVVGFQQPQGFQISVRAAIESYSSAKIGGCPGFCVNGIH